MKQKTHQFLVLQLILVLATTASAQISFVDLGLPSGTLWADRNVGAESPESYGGYFAWGETQQKDNYTWNTYFDTDDDGISFKKYNIMSGKIQLEVSDDASYMICGDAWRIPTESQWDELCNACRWEAVEEIGKKGFNVFGPNGNSIFLPAAGCIQGDRNGNRHDGEIGLYWTRDIELNYEMMGVARGFMIPSGIYSYGSVRYNGLSIRPVYENNGMPICVSNITMSVGDVSDIRICTSGLDDCVIVGFRILLPDNLLIEDIKGKEALESSNHELLAYKNTCLIYSNDNSRLSGTGALAEISLSSNGKCGTYDVLVTDIEMASGDFNLVSLPDVRFKVTVSDESGIDSVTDDINSGNSVYGVYGVSGVERGTPDVGFNIIRYLNGEVKKVYVK